MFNLFVVHSRCWAGHRLVEPVTKKKTVEIFAIKIFTNILNIYCNVIVSCLYFIIFVRQISRQTWYDFIVNILFLFSWYFSLHFLLDFSAIEKIISSIIFSIITFRFRDLQTNLDLDSKTIPTTKLSIGVFSLREYWKFIDHGGETDIASSKKKKKKKNVLIWKFHSTSFRRRTDILPSTDRYWNNVILNKMRAFSL